MTANGGVDGMPPLFLRESAWHPSSLHLLSLDPPTPSDRIRTSDYLYIVALVFYSLCIPVCRFPLDDAARRKDFFTNELQEI
jgi:hypothetical protein